MNELIDEYCSENFKYSDFVECSDTFNVLDISNVPRETKTYFFMRKFANEILEPCLQRFGNVNITYGFCDHSLAKEIKKRTGRIYPPLDQHAGMELNKNQQLICSRGGFASDFHCLPTSSKTLANYIVSELNFDRLYFYGSDRPLHVSVNEHPVRKIVLMMPRNIRVVPQRITEEKFLDIKN